ncbi:hypothetical protein HYX14_00120 [Candidatus Woesearchaeota archaeon]|nr:hypothetical protein [Candidatus Woesearchaeota archaeon]
MLGKSSVVKARCKICGQEAPADSFKLHYQHKAMVCPNCYTGKPSKSAETAVKNEPILPKKPAGWDADDDYLERAHRIRKQETAARFEPVPGTSLVKYNCHNCKYQFKYDPAKKQPHGCPYCNAEVPKVSAYNLF